MNFTECGTSCPKTCENLNRDLYCKESCLDGCFCPAGLVFNGKKCIHESQCSCTHDKKLYPSGAEIAKDCNKWSVLNFVDTNIQSRTFFIFYGLNSQVQYFKHLELYICNLIQFCQSITTTCFFKRNTKKLI